MTQSPLVSVIISTFNSERFIERKIKDLLKQTIFDKIEIIIINSGSEQNEDEIIRKYMAQYENFKYIRTDVRESIYKAWNRGIRISRGKYITNANTDDLLRPDALEILSEHLDSNNDVGIVYADQFITYDLDASFDQPDKLKIYYKLDFSKYRFLWRNFIGSQPMWRASIHFNDQIWFDESYEVAGDTEFEFRVMQKYNFLRIPEPLGIYFRSPKNENKEFKDRSLTLKESFLVREKNARAYLAALNSSELKALKIKILFHLFTPRIVFSLSRIILEKFFPYKQIPPRIFWYWFASLYYEHISDIDKSLKCCLAYQNSIDNKLIIQQLDHLKKIKNSSGGF